MTRLRRVLGPIAAAWLFCQVATLTTAPVVFWVISAEDLLECTCTLGDHAICPMHHKPAPGSKLCQIRSANDRGTAVLSSLFGAVGVVPVPTQVVAPISDDNVLLVEITTASLRPAPPDPPPPRT